MDNPSGITPTEYKVLIDPIEVEEKTAGGIFIPDEIKDRDQFAQQKGRILATSPLAFTYDEWPEGAERPEPAKCTFLDLDDDYTQAPEFGSYLTKIFNQDYLNHEAMQKGARSQPNGIATFASYQESKLRHFHDTLNLWLDNEEPPKSPKREAA